MAKNTTTHFKPFNNPTLKTSCGKKNTASNIYKSSADFGQVTCPFCIAATDQLIDSHYRTNTLKELDLKVLRHAKIRANNQGDPIFAKKVRRVIRSKGGSSFD